MTDKDLQAELAAAHSRLQERGAAPSVRAVLDSLGWESLGNSPSSRPPSLGAPLHLGRLLLGEELGRGGMGRVIEAEDPDLRRQVAIKLLVDPRRVSPEQLRRFVTEARITARLDHPNIVPVHDMGISPEGLLYFVMKKVEGRSLAELLQLLARGEQEATATWSRHRLLGALVQVCHAIAYAHDRGVLHRDLKPANVMIGRFGEVLVMDWGIARLGEAQGERWEPLSVDEGDAEARLLTDTAVGIQRTQDGAMIGSPGFMSPEQCMGEHEQIDGRTDVWSLGAILYQLLTLKPAYSQTDRFALMLAATRAPPRDPRLRFPDLDIPDEIAAVCLRAMAVDPEQRYPSVATLGAAVQAFLDGSTRRREALIRLDRAREAWAGFRETRLRAIEAGARVLTLERETEPWAPLEEKGPLLDARSAAHRLARDRMDRFEAVVAGCEQALFLDPGNTDARAFLAEVHFDRLIEAEENLDADARQHHERRVRAYDDGRLDVALRGTGALSLRTDPPGAEVLCQRFEREGLRWPLSEARSLGTTPLVAVPLEMGSYLLTLRSPGKRDTRYPIFIQRARHWDSGHEPIPLFSEQELGAGWAYVPAGPFIASGDPKAENSIPRCEPRLPGFLLAVEPVGLPAYCAFLNALQARDPAKALARSPREGTGGGYVGGFLWPRPEEGGEWRIPDQDVHGDPWDPGWPVSAVAWRDGVAFARWAAQELDAPIRLPLQLEWEKAYRGVDGRCFPWGDTFDATLCQMRFTHPGKPLPGVIGACEGDRSVYGIRDLAGGVRQFCGDPSHEGDETLRPIRGGSWFAIDNHCRGAWSGSCRPDHASMFFGFRLARDLPGKRS